MNETSRTLLVVDDDDRFRERFARALASRGFVVRAASSVSEALSLAREESPEYAVVDMKLGDGTGLSLVRDLKAIDVTTNIVVLTGYGSIATAVEAVKLGATHYLTKPADADDVIAAFARAEGRAELDETDTPSLARVEWEHIQRVLHDCDGNISVAAKKLGLHRRSLQRKLFKDPASR